MAKNNWLLIVAIVISVLALGVAVYALTQSEVSFSPSVASPSYTCYKAAGSSPASINCNSGQYCISGICSNSAPPSYVTNYGCYNLNGVSQQCANSQICYNGACVDSIAGTGYYTKAEVDAKVNDKEIELMKLGRFMKDSGTEKVDIMVMKNGVWTTIKEKAKAGDIIYYRNMEIRVLSVNSTLKTVALRPADRLSTVVGTYLIKSPEKTILNESGDDEEYLLVISDIK